MALSSYWVSQNRKDLAERALVAKRERDAYRTQKCLEVDSYHKQLALSTSKYKTLEEGPILKTPRANEESRVKEKFKAAQKDKLEYRRQKLAHILAMENKQYTKELEKLQDLEREKDPWNISRLKQQIQDLQRKRREAEQNMQKRYTHHLFNSNMSSNAKNDDILQKEAEDAWEQRKEELKRLSLEREEKEMEKCKSLELEQLMAVRESRGVEMALLDEQEKWSSLVKEKVDDLKSTEEETSKLKAEKDILIRHLETLATLLRKREIVRNTQKKTIKKMENMWQPKERLRRMLVEVQHSLDFDLKVISAVECLNKEAGEETALALLNLDCVKNVREKLEMQLAMEKQREIEILHFYNEEAGKVVTNKLNQWSLETIARDEIMEEMLKNLAKEINIKIDSNIKQAKKFIEMKESWLKDIEEANLKAKDSTRTLRKKQLFFQDRAKILGDELESLSEVKSSKPSSACGRI